jgi:hypothetical protein
MVRAIRNRIEHTPPAPPLPPKALSSAWASDIKIEVPETGLCIKR